MSDELDFGTSPLEDSVSDELDFGTSPLEDSVSDELDFGTSPLEDSVSDELDSSGLLDEYEVFVESGLTLEDE